MKLPEYRKSKGRYKFYIANPKKSFKAGDCVFRAISTAMDISWDEVYAGLCDMGYQMKDSPNCKPVYQKWLKLKGFPMRSQPRHDNYTKYTMDEFAMVYNTGSYIINLRGHMSCVKDGIIYDTWNCSKLCVGNYWKVK